MVFLLWKLLQHVHSPTMSQMNSLRRWSWQQKQLPGRLVVVSWLSLALPWMLSHMKANTPGIPHVNSSSTSLITLVRLTTTTMSSPGAIKLSRGQEHKDAPLAGLRLIRTHFVPRSQWISGYHVILLWICLLST